MTPDQFRQWRKRLGLKQKEAADQLGLKKRVIQYYEKGTRDGKKVEIPKTVRLACYALAAGVDDYDGQATTPSRNGAGDDDHSAVLKPAEGRPSEDTTKASAETTHTAGE
ncbi:MAG: helix-turn-helix transcriptional regulator [Pseudomonadota bacterium]